MSSYLAVGIRKVLAITNASTAAQVITLSWGIPAVANSGIVLQPGQSWVESIDSEYVPDLQDIWAISTAAGGVLAVKESIIGG